MTAGSHGKSDAGGIRGTASGTPRPDQQSGFRPTANAWIAAVAGAGRRLGLPPICDRRHKPVRSRRARSRISPENQGLGRAPGPRAGESRTAENRVTEPPRETRQTETQQSRGSGPQYGRQGPVDAEPARVGQSQMAPPQGGSLLGMSRGFVPLPLPAPTPVNANWSGPAGSPGSGR